MRVAVDVRSLFDQPTGLGLFAAQVIERVCERGDTIVGYSFGGKRMSATLERLMPRFDALVHSPVPMRVMAALWRNRCAPPIEDWVGPVDAVLCPEISVPVSRAPSVSFIHDILFTAHPEWFSRHMQTTGPLQLMDALKKASLIVHSSHTTANRVARFARPMAVPSKLVPPSLCLTPQQVRAPGADTVLFVGSWEPRKGLGTVAQALLRLPKLTLVAVGKPGWGLLPNAGAIELLRKQDRLRPTGYISAERLGELRRTSRLAVVPSLDEGFGLPLLEAMGAQMPTLASDIDIFREVAEDGSAFAPSADTAAWTDEIAQLTSSPARLAALSEGGYNRAAHFSVERQREAVDAMLKAVT